MRILYIHKTASESLGDGIREQAILSFLRKDPKLFEVSEVNLPIPEITVPDLLRSVSFLAPTSTLFGAHKTLGDLRLAIMFNSFHNRLKKVLSRVAFDVAISETTPVGWLTSRLFKQYHIFVPHIIDVHGLWYAEERQAGRKTWPEVMYKEIETLNSASRIFVISEAMKDFIEKKFAIDRKKMIVVPNGAPTTEEVSRYCIPFKVIYAGIFARFENLAKYLELAKRCDDPRIRFSMAGTGPLLKGILKEIERREIPIRYLGYIPRDAMLHLLTHFQAGLIFSNNNVARKIASPIKILDYASRGLPIIAPRVGDWGKLVQTENIGFSVEGNVEDYVDAIRRLMNRRQWHEKSRNAILFAKCRQWSEVLQPIYKCFCEPGS